MKHAKKYIWTAAQTRLAFKSGHGHGPVTLNQGEFEIFQDVNAVEAITDEIFESHGMFHSRHQAVEKPRAGTRKWMESILPKGILSKRVSDDFLKGEFPAEAATEHESGVHHHFKVPKGFFGKVKHFFHKMRVGENGLRFEEALGTKQDVDSMRTFTADNVLKDLDREQQEAVQNYLEENGVPLPPGRTDHERRVLQIGNAAPALIRQMRGELEIGGHRVFPPEIMDPLYPTTKAQPPAHAIDRFIQFRKKELKQAHNEAITTVFDKQRLANQMRTIQVEHPDIYKLIVEDILQPEALHAIEGVPENEALIYYLEHRFKTRGPADLENELKGISGGMQTEEEKKGEHADVEHPEKDKAEAKKLEEAVDKISTNYSQLDDLYAMAPSAGKELFNWKKNYIVQTEGPQQGGGQQRGGGQNKGQNLQHLTGMIKETTTNKDRMFREILALEETFMKDATLLQKLLKDKIKDVDESKIVKLQDFIKKFVTEPPKKSDEPSLFGKTEPDSSTDTYGKVEFDKERMRQAFSDFPPKELKAMKGEIEENFSKGLKKKKKKTPFQLLKDLMEGAAARRGIVANENRSITGMAAAERIVGMARRKQALRSGNLEREEWLTTGRMGRAKKWLKAKMGIGGMQEARDMIDTIAGMDKKTVGFKGMPKGISKIEFINWVDTHGIKEDAIFEFMKKLEEGFKRFEKAGHEGTVQLYDEDAYYLEELTELMMTVRGVLRARRYHFEARNKEAAKEGDKAKAIFDLIREKHNGEMDEEKSLLERVSDKAAEWKSFFSKRVLKQKFFETLRAKKKEAKEQKLSQADFEHGINHDGLRTAYEVLRTGLAAKEAADVTVAAAKGAGKLGKRFGKGVLKPVFWDYSIRPVAKHGIARPVSWAFGKGGPVRTVGKAVAFPFVLAGSIVGGAWNWAVPSGKSSGGTKPAAAHHQ